MRERGKFEEETFVNVAGRTRNTSDQVREQVLVCTGYRWCSDCAAECPCSHIALASHLLHLFCRVGMRATVGVRPGTSLSW
jgi:hypothetical protein